MKRQTILFVMLQMLAGCQTDHAPSPFNDGAVQEGLNEASAASVAADLTKEVAPFLPPGSALAFLPDDKDAISLALRDHLTRSGFRVVSGTAPGETPAKGAILLRIWSTRSGQDLMVRLSTPSHRLSRIYRDGEEGLTRDGDTSTRVAHPMGPLVVETIDPGGHP
jgi:hypothetical protein